MNIYSSVAELVGNTPLLELCRYEKKHGLHARMLAKLECRNPAGSAKDRVAKHMIECAEAEGKLTEGSVIIEPTSGNTGIGLAAMAKVHGYRVILTMPESMSVERRNLLKAYGAELVLTPAAEGMAGAVRRAEELAAETLFGLFPVGLPIVMHILSLLFCFIQAMVFTMLLAVFINEATEDEE